MIKQILKNIFFQKNGPNKIKSGVSSGMLTHYDPNHRSLHLLGLYEREIYPFLLDGIVRAKTLVDIGANDGYYGLAFLKHKNPSQEIILCEPSQAKEDLRKNLSLNKFTEGKDFALVEKFVSDVTNGDRISIRDLIQGKGKVFVLMDVDGAEVGIINSWNEHLGSNEQTQIEWLIETHSKEIEESLQKIFKDRGYKTKVIDKAWWRIFVPEKRPLAHNRWMHAIRD